MQIQTQSWPVLDVIAAALAAHEINHGYEKFPEMDITGQLLKPTNLQIMTRLLKTNQEFTTEQREQAQQIQQHCQTLLFAQLSGQLSGYLAAALRVTAQPSIATHNRHELGLVASLPSYYQKEMQRNDQRQQLQPLIDQSQWYGMPGLRLHQPEMQVVSCNYSRKWSSWLVHAVMGHYLFFFFYSTELQAGQTVRLRGTVKQHRENNITQLHRVRVEHEQCEVSV
jgi:hypothetical protein